MSDTTLFRTLVETPLSCHPIQPQEGCILLGSCFAQEMGNYMNAYEMDVLCNPTGTLYNPASISMLGRELLSKYEPEGSTQAYGGRRSARIHK